MNGRETEREREKLFSNVKVASHCSAIVESSLFLSFFCLLGSMLKKREEEEEEKRTTTGERPTVGDEKWKEEGRQRQRRRERRRQSSRRGEFFLFLSFTHQHFFVGHSILLGLFLVRAVGVPHCVRLGDDEGERERGHDAVATSTFRDTFALLVWRGKKQDIHLSSRRKKKKSTTASDTPLCFLSSTSSFPRPFPFTLSLMAIMMMMTI